MGNDKSGFHIGAGITSIFMLFVVLCLTVFAVLSYGRAKSDYMLSKEAADNLDVYYQARNKSVREISRVNEIIMNNKGIEDKDNFLDNTRSVLNEEGFLISEKGNVVISVKISEKQTLITELEINEYDKANGVTILRSYINTTGKIESQGVPIITE